MGRPRQPPGTWDDFEHVIAEEETVLDDIDEVVEGLPQVSVIDHPDVPSTLGAATFFKKMVERVLRGTPITMHRRARELHGWPVGESPEEKKKRVPKQSAEE